MIDICLPKRASRAVVCFSLDASLLSVFLFYVGGPSDGVFASVVAQETAVTRMIGPNNTFRATGERLGGGWLKTPLARRCRRPGSIHQAAFLVVFRHGAVHTPYVRAVVGLLVWA